MAQVQAVRGIDLEVVAGQVPRAARAERRRQDHDDAHDHGADHADRPASSPCSARRPARSAAAQKARIGLVPQDDNLDPDLSVRQNLDVYGRYFSLPRAVLAERIPALLAFMALGDKAGSSVNQLSGGMKRRLVIARALISDPELVILDEPTTGLDPQARVMIWKQLLDLKRRGKTLLLTTHYMDEAQRLCDEIIIDRPGPDPRPRHAPGADRPARQGPRVRGAEAPAGGLRDGRFEQEDIGDAILYYVETPRGFTEELPEERGLLAPPGQPRGRLPAADRPRAARQLMQRPLRSRPTRSRSGGASIWCGARSSGRR